VFFGTPPHFWALSLNRAGDYGRAKIPALPVVSGEDETRRQILAYTLLLVRISLLSSLLGFATAFYGAGERRHHDSARIAIAARQRSAKKSRQSPFCLLHLLLGSTVRGAAH
jgi:heme O synthase-like polyprenyltransferase